MKKISIIVLSILIFSASIVQAKTFIDLSEEHWAYSAVDTMVEMKIINGYPDGTFLPEKLITKAEFAKILVETLGLENMYEEIEYTDVPYEFWAYEYINIADQYFKPVPFKPGNMFYPNKTLTREEVATIIVRAMWLQELEYNTETLEKVLDNDEISDELKKYVAIAYEQNLMHGNANGTFNPKGDLTRAQVCQLMKNVIEIKNQEKEIYDSLAGRWLPEKAFDKNGKKVSLKKVFNFEITDKNKLILDQYAAFDDYLYSYYEDKLISRNYGSYQVVGNEIILIHNAYEFERLTIKEERNIRYLVREIEIRNKNKTEKYTVYYKLQDKTDLITDVVGATSPKMDELIDNTIVKVNVDYYDEIKSGKLKITNSKNEILESNVELNYSTISTTIQCEPNETYTVTAYEVLDMNGYKFEDYTYEFLISNELANLGPQYRKYSSKKVLDKYKLEDYPEYEDELNNLIKAGNYNVTGYKLYDINNDKKPELLVAIDGKIKLIYRIDNEQGVIYYRAQTFFEICENGIVLNYLQYTQNESIVKLYMFSEFNGKEYKDVNTVISYVDKNEIRWQEDKERGIGTGKRISKEEFYDTLDKYKILKIELDNYIID